MDKQSIIICILLAIITTNLIRVVPMLLIKPYVTLAVMTFPSMIQTTLSPLSGTVALVVGIIAAWRRMGLFPVAIICCAIVYLMDTLIQ